MTIQEISEMETLLDRFNTETEKMAETLDKLTTGGEGSLAELKDAVGAQTELGMRISTAGTAVMSARENAVRSLKQIAEIMQNKINDAKSYNAQADAGFGQSTSQIEGITFQ